MTATEYQKERALSALQKGFRGDTTDVPGISYDVMVRNRMRRAVELGATYEDILTACKLTDSDVNRQLIRDKLTEARYPVPCDERDYRRSARYLAKSPDLSHQRMAVVLVKMADSYRQTVIDNERRSRERE